MTATAVVSCKVEPEIKARLIEVASREGKSVNEFMAGLIERLVSESSKPAPADALTAEVGKLLFDPESRKRLRDTVKTILKELDLEATPLDHAIGISTKRTEERGEGKPEEEKKEEGGSREVEPLEPDSDDELTNEEWEAILKDLRGEKKNPTQTEACPECGTPLPSNVMKQLDAGERAFCPECGVQLEKDESTERGESTPTWQKVALGITGAVALLYTVARLASARSA
jgi:hypothetical protein